MTQAWGCFTPIAGASHLTALCFDISLEVVIYAEGNPDSVRKPAACSRLPASGIERMRTYTARPHSHEIPISGQ
jgi:hypothetical protein